jgi:hypothetical protein
MWFRVIETALSLRLSVHKQAKLENGLKYFHENLHCVALHRFWLKSDDNEGQFMWKLICTFENTHFLVANPHAVNPSLEYSAC